MIHTKNELVKLDALRPQLKRLLPSLDILFHEQGLHLCITCGTEGHPDDDPHSHGFAIDVRSHELPREIQREMRERIQHVCGMTFTVLLESEDHDNEHYHIQLKKNLWRAIVAEERDSKIAAPLPIEALEPAQRGETT